MPTTFASGLRINNYDNYIEQFEIQFEFRGAETVAINVILMRFQVAPCTDVMLAKTFRSNNELFLHANEITVKSCPSQEDQHPLSPPDRNNLVIYPVITVNLIMVNCLSWISFIINCEQIVSPLNVPQKNILRRIFRR